MPATSFFLSRVCLTNIVYIPWVPDRRTGGFFVNIIGTMPMNNTV